MDNQKKYIVSVPSLHSTEEWSQDVLDKNKDKLLKKYPDARISKLAFWSDNKMPPAEEPGFSLDAANAQLQQQTGVPAPEAPKAYAPSPMDEAAADEYRAEQKVIQDAQRQAEEEYLASLPDDQREYVELMNSAAGIMERLGTYRDRLDAEDSDKAALRRLRSNDEDALDKVYEGLNNNTYYKAQLARQTEDIETLKDRIAVNAPDILADYPAIKGDPYASRGPEGDMKAANLEAAGRFAEDARKAISAPLRYDDSKGLANYAKGVGSVLSDPDFWTMGITDVQDKAQLRAVLQKVNDAYGSADDIDSKIDQGNLDGILDLDEQYLLQSYLQMQDARSARYHDTSRGYKAGAGSAESAGFMLEMALTSGLGGAVKSGVTKGLGKWLLKGTQKIGTATKAGKIAKATSREAAKLVAGQTGNVLSAAARMPFMPSSYGAIAEQGTVVGDDGQLVSLGQAIKEGTLDNLTEVVTEGMGPATMAAISNTVGAAGLGTLLKKISRTRVGEFARKVANSPAYETMKKMGYDGLGEELLEEFDAAVIDQVRGNPEAIRDFVQTDNLLTTVLSFAPMTIMGGAVSTGQKMYAGNRLEKTAQTLRDKLIDAGYTQSQADYFIDVTRNSTPQEISMVLTPVLNQFAEGNMAGAAAGMPTTGDLFNAVKEYGKAVVRYQAFDGIYQQQEQNQRTEVKNSILEKTGDNFWVEYENGSRPTVETGTLADGTEVYIVSSVDENGVAAAITTEGKKMFVNAAMLPEGTQIRSLDEYLSEQVMSRKLTAEQKRIEEEKAARAQQVREQAQPGSQINLGTAEAPVIGEVIRQAPDGIIVQTENGVSLLSWDEAANVMNIGAAPLTDEQIEQQEVAQMEAADAEKDAAMAETEEEAADAVVETEAAQQDEVVSEPLPVKADGSVDQTTLWNQSPERWAQWNDEQRQDGGANSLNYISGAIAKEQAKLDEMTAAYNAESDFDVRSAMEPELAESQDRIARLAELQQKYVPAEQIQEEVKEEAPAAPAVEPQPAEMSEDEARANEIRQTLYDLYNDDSLSEAEIEQYVEANVKGSQEDLDKHMKKAPQMGRDMAKYKEAKATHEAKAEELRKQRDFWREAQTYVTIPEASEADMEPQNALEFAARELSSRSGIKLQPESFKRHTGYGSEASKFLSVQRSKAKGGMTLEEAGERLMELDRENNTGFFDQNDPNAGLNAILDVIQSSATSGDLGSYIRNAREQAARQEVAAAREAMMAEMGQPAAQEEETPQPETEFVSTLEEDMPEDIWEGASRQVTNAMTSAEDLEEVDNTYQQRLAEVDTRMAAAQSEEERRAATDERAAVLQQYMDEISSEDKAKVLTPYNYAEVMRADGCSEQSIREVEDAVNNPLVILGGFMCNGRIYVMTDVADINKARRAYVHERQHNRTRNDKPLIDRVLKAIPDRRTLLMFVEALSGTDDYRGYSNEVLADELISFAMERAYSAEDFVSSLQYSGIYSQEFINIINDITNEQREDSSLSKARRGQGLYSHERRRAQGTGRQNGGAQRAGSSEVAEQRPRSSERGTEGAVSKQVTGLPLPSDNRQLEGNVRFSKSNGTLVGMHNISEEKLRKVIRQGGSANPSTAVVDIARQSFDSYGDISLVMPSSLVDAGTGRNAGTFTADAWTPVYPQVVRRFSDDKLQRVYWKDISALPEEMQGEARQGFDGWRDDRNSAGLAYMFLHERGEAPELVRVEPGYPKELRDKMSSILNDRTSFYQLSADEKQAVIDLYIEENFGGDREKFNQSIAEHISRIEDRLGKGKVPSFMERRLTEDLNWMKEHGYHYENVASFVSKVSSDLRNAGTIDENATTNKSVDYIKEKGLSEEFERWKEGLAERYSIKEYLFAGYTPSGNQKWLPNTIENASRLMNKEGLAGSTGFSVSFNRFVATLAPKKKSLSDIRSAKERLTENADAVEEFREKWTPVYYDLGIKCQPDAERFEDYGLARLEEAAQKKNPGAYLKKEYGVELSQEDLQKLSEMIKAIKTEFPARYFETKFQRPVYLNEFAAAVMPTDAGDDIKQAVSEAGLPVFEYDPSVEGSRREAALKASEVEGVRFQIGRAKDKVENLFTDAVNGRFKGKPVSIGTLTEEGKKYLESISGLTFKDKVDFVLNSSDLMHMYNEHFGANEKDPGSNIPLTIDDIRNIVDVILNPEKVLYLGEDDGKRFAFLAPADSGAYNLIEVYTTKRGNLSSKTFYKTKKGVSHRAMILEKESRHSTSETNGATLSDAKIPILFDIANQKESGVRFQKSNRNQAIFVSNAARAVEEIKQEKATPEQWLKMLEKAGGLKAGEDKWMGLSDWLKASDKKTLTKQEVLDFINENMIVIEEVHYVEGAEEEFKEVEEDTRYALQEIYDEYIAESEDMNDDMFMSTHYDYAIQKLAESLGYEAWNAPFVNMNATIRLDLDPDFAAQELNDIRERLGMPRNVKEENGINGTRLKYTTRGLANNHEIALTVPSIEPWNESDVIHFGDAGDGRAVAWIRFGETEVPVQDAAYTRLQEIYDRLSELEMKVSYTGISHEEYEERARLREERNELQEIEPKTQRVLVIDEIQSKRHQEGREQGYKDIKSERAIAEAKAKLVEKREALKNYLEFLESKYGIPESLKSERATDEEMQKLDDLRNAMYDADDELVAVRMANPIGYIPDAPFEKNWHELAMKRMLRYAAENGYDVIAWTKGDQQAERYNIGSYVSSIEMQEEYDGKRDYGFYMGDADEATTVTVDENGTVLSAEGHLSQAEGRPLADLVGKEMAVKMMQMEEHDVLEDTDLKVGNEGMKGFYDKMLPAFMNKYGKKWGVKVEDIELPNLENGLTMHSVPVTEEMKESVMEGQVMFQKTGITSEVREEMDRISANAIMDGTYMQAPNGKPTNLTADQWALVRTEGFKRWFGDWEKAARIQKLRDSKPVTMKGDEYEGKYELNRDSAQRFILDELRDTYTIADTKERIRIVKKGAKKVTSHSMGNDAHMKSIAIIPEIIRSAIFITEMPADKADAQYDSYRYYVCGLDYAGESYTVKMTVGVKNGDYYYDHTLTDIEKGKLLDMIESQQGVVREGFTPTGNESDPSYALSDVKDRKLISILQNNSSKVVDENGEPKVVYHGTNLTATNKGLPFWEFYEDSHFGTKEQAKELAKAGKPESERKIYGVFLNIRNLKRVDDVPQDWIETHSEYWEPVYEEAKQDGYDGLVYVNEWEDSESKEDSYVVWNSNQIKSATDNTGEFSSENPDIRFQLRRKPAPRKTGIGYKVFYLKDGKLYPPMVANLGGVDTPVGVWLDAEEGTRAGVSKTGRPKVKQGGKGTQGGSGTLAYRPGWHLGEIPYAIQFNRKDENGDRTLFPADFVWAEVEYANDVDYQEEAMSYGMNANGKFQHSLAGLPKLPVDGSYRYRTNPNPETDPWIITGAMKVNRLLTPSEVDRMVADAGRMPQKRQEGAVTDEQIEELNDLMGLTGKASDIRFSKIGTLTDKVVNDGLRLSQDESARLAGNIFEALPESARESIVGETFRNGFDMKSAIFQMSARLAEKEELTDEEADMAKAIAQQVENAVIGGGVSMTRPLTTPEALWMLYRHINDSSDIIGAAREAMVADNLGFSAAAAEGKLSDENYIRFQKVRRAYGDSAANMYNADQRYAWGRLRESFQDMNRSVDNLMQAIETSTGKKAEAWENIVMALNRLSSKNLADKMRFMRDYIKPMWETVLEISDRFGLDIDQIERYLMLKHGLERNIKLAARDARAFYQAEYNDKIAKIDNDDSLSAADKNAQKITAESELNRHFADIDAGTDAKFLEFRNSDYGGITAMMSDFTDFGTREDYETEELYQAAALAARQPRFDNLEDAEDAARQEVETFENQIGAMKNELWKKINAATKATLKHQYDNNMMSKEQYDHVRKMFDFYVPLRGFADNTAEDIYSYYTSGQQGKFANPLITAKGRKTQAETPLGWIGMMAESAIQMDNKNDAKLRLYYFAVNRPENDLLRVTETWYEWTGEMDAEGRKIFEPVYPTFRGPLDGAAMEAHMDAFNSMMEIQAAAGNAFRGKRGMDLQKSVINIEPRNKPEHVVTVKVAGKDYSIIINGNPRAAQAINGLLNIDQAEDNPLYQGFRSALRLMSGLSTSLNPEFWISNFQRDAMFAFLGTSAKNDAAYTKEFAKNYMKAFKVISMLRKDKKGTLGSSETERLYNEFVENGGVTGYTVLVNNTEYDEMLRKFAKDQRRSRFIKGVKSGFEAIADFGEAIEQVSRFAAYMTARKSGKSVEESVYEAKEVTVNFNRKGSGKAISWDESAQLRDRKGKPLSWAERVFFVGASSLSPVGRSIYMFFNASIQGLRTAVKLAHDHPGKSALWAGFFFTMGMVNAVLHAALDDDDDYMDMPDHEKRNNLLIGRNGVYFKWALPQEVRPFYSMADIFVNHAMGRSPHKNITTELANAFAEMLPVNTVGAEGLEGIAGALMPSYISPFYELIINRNFTGGPIYREMPWVSEEEQKYIPAYEKAYSSTNQLYVDVSKILNNLSGGDYSKAGAININPAAVEHIVEGYGGGLLTTVNKMMKTMGVMFGDQEFTFKNTPFLSRLITVNDERYRNSYVTELFDYYKAIAADVKRREKAYKEANDEIRRRELLGSDEHKILEIYNKYQDQEFKALDKALKLARNEEERRNVMKRQDAARRRLIEEIANL